MSKKVSVLAIAALLIVTMVFAACQNTPAAEAPAAEAPAAEAPAEEAPADAAPSSDFVFGNLSYDLADVWAQYSLEAFQWCADLKGVEVKSLDAQKMPETQVTQAQELINLGVDAIGLYPITPEGGATIVRMANEAGIPIAVENMFLPDGSGDIIGNIACQYNDIGYAAIEYTADQFPGSKMLWVQGSPGLGVTEVYAIGVDEALEIYGDKVEVVGMVNGEFATEPAYNVTTDFINLGKEFDVIFAQNDLMAFGAYNALKENGMEEIPIFSTGGSPQGYQMMQDGQQFANMTAPVNIQGVHQFNFLWRHMNGLDIPEVKVPLPIIPVDVNSIGDWIHWDDFQASYDFIGGIEP